MKSLSMHKFLQRKKNLESQLLQTIKKQLLLLS